MYYGARYYDPRTSVWQSPDRILGVYLTGKPNGGIGNSFNLNLYAYTYQNPVRLVDPNGKEIWVPMGDKGNSLNCFVQDVNSRGGTLDLHGGIDRGILKGYE